MFDIDSAIDAVAPGRVVQVEDEAELAELLKAVGASSASREQVVVPFGGGTALGIGNVPARVDLAIDLSRLIGVSNYNPSDLTLTVRAGTTLATLRSELAQHGQELPIDMPLAQHATIGGLMATAFSGPRRYGSGTMKDALIGSSFVRGDGLSAKAGGMVVKNVSGFEMSRFLHGSWGALAVITSVNLKITPIPKADRTVVIPVTDVSEAIRKFRIVVAAGVTPASAEIVTEHGATQLLLRFLGRVSGVAEQERILASSGVSGDRRAMEGVDSGSFWSRLTDDWATGGDHVQVVIGVRPRDVESVIASLVTADGPVVSRSLVSPGTGSIRLSIDPATIAPDRVWSWLHPVRELILGSAFIEFAPIAWKRQIDVWGPRPQAVGLMKSIKQQFDPSGVLNRGRMVV